MNHRCVGMIAVLSLVACAVDPSGPGGARSGSSSGGSSSSSSGSSGGSSGGAAPPSCQAGGPGQAECGSARESCCTSLGVPGGTYHRTYLNDGGGPTGLADPATVSAFRLDKFLVTVGRYRAFVAAWKAGYRPPLGAGKHRHLNGGVGLADSGTPGAHEPGWTEDDTAHVEATDDSLACNPDYATWTRTPGAQENLPVNCVNWWEAHAFCIWDGGFLPAEAEYQYAAAGGAEQRRYPWGAAAPGTASRYAILGCAYPDGPGSCSGVRNLAPVGFSALGAGRFGQVDLVGELSEWNLDWHAPYVSPCVDCANLTPGSGRVIRDGYFVSDEALLLVSYRNSFYPTNRFYSFGFRCARAP